PVHLDPDAVRHRPSYPLGDAQAVANFQESRREHHRAMHARGGFGQEPYATEAIVAMLTLPLKPRRSEETRWRRKSRGMQGESHLSHRPTTPISTIGSGARCHIYSPSSKGWTRRSGRQSRAFTMPSSGKGRTTGYQSLAGSSNWPRTTSR